MPYWKNLLVESQLVGNRVQSSSMSGMSISYHGFLIRKALNLSNKHNCPRSTPVVSHQLADLSLKKKKNLQITLLRTRETPSPIISIITIILNVILDTVTVILVHKYEY